MGQKSLISEKSTFLVSFSKKICKNSKLPTGAGKKF
jgi:hypothetical protein